MFNTVIAGYARSPFTMANKGGLANVEPLELISQVIKNLVSNTKINLNEIEDVIIGCAFQVGEQSFNIGRLATLLADLDI